jgi:hypothetical protein
VPINSAIDVSFNQAMNASTINTTTFLVTIPPSTTPIGGTVTYDATNHIAIFTPSSPLTPSTTYKVTITTGVESADGVFLASDYVFTFTTSASGSTTPPTVISTNPNGGATGVATNQKITATFSEQMLSTTITGTTFTLVDTTTSTPVSGTVTYSIIGATATFTPSSALATGNLFTATITTGATDLEGNAIATAVTWTFTTGSGTDTTAPTITLTNPANGATGVDTTASVNATFSKAMDPATLNPATFTLVDTTASAPVSGKITYDSANWIVTLTPTSALTSGHSFTATVTTGAKDLEGNALAAGAVPNPWSFTAGSTTGLSPGAINLGAASGYVIFGQTTVTNSGSNVINGNLGLYPGTSVTGFPPGVINGLEEVDNSTALAVLTSLNTAYGDASPSSIPGGTSISGNQAGVTLPPGVYTSTSTLGLSGGNLTLDAQGNENAVWIIQVDTAITLTAGAPSCDVILANGAQAANVFWWTGTSVTIGGGCAMVGNILAGTAISFSGTGATLNGRALVSAPTGGTFVAIAGTLGGPIGAPGACSQ